MTKCWSIDTAKEALSNAVFDASLLPTVDQRLEVIFRSIVEVRDKLDPLFIPEAMEELSTLIKEDPIIEASAAGYRYVFSDSFNLESYLDRMSKLDGEETDDSKEFKKRKVQKEFIKKCFTDNKGKTADRAALYFNREARNLLIEAFLIDRTNGYLVAEGNIKDNVQNLKLRLLDTVVEYLKDLGYTENLLGITSLFDETGDYMGILDPDSDLRKAIDAKLSINKSFKSDFILNHYNNFKTKGNNWEKSKLFISAYNAKLLLDDFDNFTSIFLGSVVLPGGKLYNEINNDTYYTKFNRATNMWGNQYGDDVDNIANIVSDVTQKLIQVSKKYMWKGEAMEDLYISFLEFNYIMTKIKDFVKNPISKDIILDGEFLSVKNKNYNPSSDTLRTLRTLTKLKANQGEQITDPTFWDVLAFISDNPQRHLHTIFDLLCNTNILEEYKGITDNDKNLIWSVGKEIFGSWNSEIDAEGNTIPSRSLYDLHKRSDGDKIFEIITLISDTMFAEGFLQYYEDQEGTLKIRFLQDYAIAQIKNDILHKMAQTNGMYNVPLFTEFLTKHNIEIKTKSPRAIYPEDRYYQSWELGEEPLKVGFLESIQIPIKTTLTIPDFIIEYANNTVKIKNLSVTADKLEQVWKSEKFRDFIKDTIGIDFNQDVELCSAYEECFKDSSKNGQIINYKNLIDDISRICGNVVFNQTFNNKIVPEILDVAKRDRTRQNITLLRDILYGKDGISINFNNGTVLMISDNNKEAYLRNLGLAYASVSGLLTAAQVKTGEGTSLASLCLSCLRSSHAYQILTQNKNKDSATKHLTYVKNENGFFRGLVSRREFKNEYSTKVNTDMSAVESFTASFLGGFVGAFVKNPKDPSAINRNGNILVFPAVYSDKTRLDELLVDLKAVSPYSLKRYIDMTDAELDQELRNEFGNMYDQIINNINEENTRFIEILGVNSKAFTGNCVVVYRQLLDAISKKLCDSDTLLNLVEEKYKNDPETARLILDLRKSGMYSSEIIKTLSQAPDLKKGIAKIRKNRIVEEMHSVLTKYNIKHRCEPIELCEHVHYIFNKEGSLVPNDTLIALWGRFKGNADINNLLGITELYPKGHEMSSTAEGYFRYEKDIQLAEELLKDGFEIYLRGALAKEKQEELQYLKDNYPTWITNSGKMALAKIFVPNHKYRIGDVFYNEKGTSSRITGYDDSADGKYYTVVITKPNEEPIVYRVSEIHIDASMSQVVDYKRGLLDETDGQWEITLDSDLIAKKAKSKFDRDMIKVHPMLTKMNRITYLAALLYVSSVGGAHYVYKGGGTNVLEEEATRWLASNKRNVCYASTVHKYQNKTLTGVPKYYQIAPLEDIRSKLYTIMGDLEEHKPIDGGMYVNPWFGTLENNSLAGEAAGADKKQFGTYYYEKYCAGGIIKTAGFLLTNQRQRNSIAYRYLCENMTNRTWIKEFPRADGSDIEEVLNITRDFRGNEINWIQDANGKETFYERDTNNGQSRGRFKLARIESLGNNQYKIFEYPVTKTGLVDKTKPGIKELLPSEDDHSPEAQELRELPLEPVQRMDGSDNGIFTINSNWDLYNIVFGGAWSLSLDENGFLEPSEHSVEQMVYALNNIGYERTVDNNNPEFGNERYDDTEFEKSDSQDEVWQPLKYSDISYAPNIGALKSTLMNVNPKEAMYEKRDLNAMKIMMALLGIQLDKEHHADNAEVSMPTQIIQACANKGYTIHYADKLYNALSTLTELAISDCMDGIMELMPGNENRGTLLTKVADIIVGNLIRTKDDTQALEAAMRFLIEKAKNGQKLSPEDVIGHTPLSDSSLYTKVYKDLASHFTNSAIKMKFAGTLSVICPTEKMEQMFGDRRLSAYADVDLGLTEKAALERHLEAIRRGYYPDLQIYDINNYEPGTEPSITDKLSLGTKLDTQHHYWIEWEDLDGKPVLDKEGNIFRESVTIDDPRTYIKVKNWLAYDATDGYVKINGESVPRKGMRVARIYENITEGRELGAYNARFEVNELSDTGRIQRFSIFDLDSVRALFDFNDLEKTLDNAENIITNETLVDPFKATRGILNYLKKNTPKTFEIFKKELPNEYDLNDVLEIALELDATNLKNFIDATFKVGRVLTYKTMEKDLFKISKDYEGSRLVYINEELVTVNPDSIKTLAYELIMPKVYQSKFGLKEGDLVQEILADKDFFTKRAIDKVKTQHVAENCFHYELKNFNGRHVYIWDSKLGEPDPDLFRPVTINKMQESETEWSRLDLDGRYIHPLASENDSIMKIGKIGYEVIVTDHPEFYLENLDYNLVSFSNETVSEEDLLQLVETLKHSDSKKAKSFVRTMTTREGVMQDFKLLLNRNTAISEISLEKLRKQPPEIKKLVQRFIKEGNELHSSFNKSLDIIAGRIPAQSQQSFMPLRVVAFDNNNINTAYVSTWQLFLLGSKNKQNCTNK